MTGCLALLRVRIPDRPGALGLVASRIGALKADIVGIEVLDRTDGTALDELTIVLPNERLIPALTREIAEVDGTVTESVTIVDALPEPRLDGVRAAITLSRARGHHELASSLAEEASRAVRADWCAVTDSEGVLASTPGAPADAAAIETATTHVAVVGTRSASLVIGRVPTLRAGEHQLIAALCELADTMWDRPHTDA